MKTKITFLALLFFATLALCGQQAATVPMKVTTTQQVAESSPSYQDFKQLQDENQRLKENVEKLEKEVDKCREDVRDKSSDVNTNLTIWTGLIFLFVTLIATVLGVIAPLYINRRNDEKLQKQIEDTTTVINTKIKKVEEIAQQAKIAARNAKTGLFFIQALKENDNSAAIKLYSRILDFNDDDDVEMIDLSVVYNNRGKLFSNMNKVEEALLDYNEAIKLAPNYATPYNNRGLLYKAMNNYEKALLDLNKAIELEPNDGEKYYNRGNLLTEMKKYEDALKDFNLAIELKPLFYEAYSNRGILLNEMKRYDEALKDFNLAIKLRPQSAGSFQNRGYLFLSMGKYENALLDYDKALNMDTNEKNYLRDVL